MRRFTGHFLLPLLLVALHTATAYPASASDGSLDAQHDGALVTQDTATRSADAPQEAQRSSGRRLFGGTRPVAGAAEASAPGLSAGQGRSFLDELLPTGIALGATLLVIVLSRSVIRRAGNRMGGGKRPEGVVAVLARYPIARGQQIVLLKVGRRVIVTHQGPQGMQPLSEFAAEADVADLVARCEAGSRASGPFSFDALLRQSGGKLDAASSVAARPSAGPVREALPPFMRGAEIETVDLTRARRGGAR